MGRLALANAFAPLFWAAALGANAQSVLINEFQAANDSTVTDPDFGEYTDWVELYNAAEIPVDVGGYYLTDDLLDPEKWRIPDGSRIEAGGYLLIWADDRSVALHAGFRLARPGEQIGLFDAAGTEIDAVTFGEQRPGVSFGRAPDGSKAWRFFVEPSPGQANPADGRRGLTPPPVASPRDGFYPAAISVALSSEPDSAVIRYSLDGSVPTVSSAVYNTPLVLAQTRVVRAAVFREDYVPSEVITHTYLIGEHPSLPVVSLTTDPAHFFDDRIGIYVEGTNGIPGYCRSTPKNWNQAWERPIHVAFFEPDGRLGFSIDAGVQIFGGCTRIYPQKSLAIYARSKYGASKINYRIFPDVPIASFNNMVLRSSAQDWWRTMFRDGMIQTTISQGFDLETQAYRPAIVFLNGVYWGIHNIREKQNEHYLAAHFGGDPSDFAIIQGDEDEVGGVYDHYNEMMTFVNGADMSEQASMDVVRGMMDVDGYIDYLIAEIYSANADWPGNNRRLWRRASAEGRWRWMIFDMDFGFGGNANGQVHSNTLALATDPNGSDWPNPPWSTLLLRRLLDNTAFRYTFIQRFAAHVNTTFEPGHVLAVIDSLRTRIAAEIPHHKARWPQSMSFGDTWDDLVDIMRDFARGRPLQVRGHFNDAFSLPGSARLNLQVSDAAAGHVEAAGVRMPGPAFGAVFFRGVPLALRAVPHDGYRFDRWEGVSASTSDTVDVMLTGEATLYAFFSHTGVSTARTDEMPRLNRLRQNFPNPLTDAAVVELELADRVYVTVVLTDLLGREVGRPHDGWLPPGRHHILIDGSPLPAGVYFYTARSEDFVQTKAMIVVK